MWGSLREGKPEGDKKRGRRPARSSAAQRYATEYGIDMQSKASYIHRKYFQPIRDQRFPRKLQNG